MSFSTRAANSPRHTRVNIAITTSRIVSTGIVCRRHRARRRPPSESPAMIPMVAIPSEGRDWFDNRKGTSVTLSFVLVKPKHRRRRNPRYPTPTVSPVRSPPFVERRRHRAVATIRVDPSFVPIGSPMASSVSLGFPFKIEHAHLPQLLHFTDEVPARFTNAVAATAASSSSLPSSATTPSGSMTALAASIANNGSIVLGALQPSAMIPSETQPASLMSTASAAACINKSLDAKK